MGRKGKKREPEAPYQIESRISRMMDVPMSLLPEVFQLEFSGNREAVLNGCSGIREYGEGVTTAGAGKVWVKFCGDIRIRSMTEDSIVIEGVIQSVSFLPAPDAR